MAILNGLQSALVRLSVPFANRRLFQRNYSKRDPCHFVINNKMVSIIPRMKRSLKHILYLLKFRKYP